MPGPDAIRVALVRSQTFMNESGIPVGKLAGFYGIEPSHVLAIHDELDLEPGQMRLKLGGSDNGHNGLKSMRAHLGTGDFHRLRFGIGRPPGRQPAADYVLAPMPAKAREALGSDVTRAADAVEILLLEGLATAQNRFNS